MNSTPHFIVSYILNRILLFIFFNKFTNLNHKYSKSDGAEEIITELEHGDANVKQNLDMLLEPAQSGDTIICCEESHLSCLTQQLCEIVNIIKTKHMRPEILGSIIIACRTGDIHSMG